MAPVTATQSVRLIRKMKSDPLHVHGALWGPGPGCLLALCSHSLHSPLSSHLPSHATMSSHMLLPGSGASFASSSSSSKGEGACCAPGTVLSILFTLSHEVGTIISLHLTGDKDKISSGRLCSQIHALLLQLSPSSNASSSTQPSPTPSAEARSGFISGETEGGDEF